MHILVPMYPPYNLHFCKLSSSLDTEGMQSLSLVGVLLARVGLEVVEVGGGEEGGDGLGQLGETISEKTDSRLPSSSSKNSLNFLLYILLRSQIFAGIDRYTLQQLFCLKFLDRW